MAKVVAVLVMTDGRRQYIRDTLRSATMQLSGNFGPKFIFDDSGDEENHEWLRNNFPNFNLIYKPTRQGFGGAINSAWQFMKDYEFDYVFHLEDDFTFNRPVYISDMAKVLDENPNLYQVALKRQPWSAEEMRYGGFMERSPESFHQRDGWISHKTFFTTNPSLYRRSLIENHEFPSVKEAEGLFFWKIKESDPDAEFGYWGNITDSPWVTHNGAIRNGSMY